jgi:hypothetical protein
MSELDVLNISAGNRYLFGQKKVEDLVIFACRYVVGRSTYAPHEYMDAIEPLIPYLSNGCIACLIRDIEREGRTWGFGAEMDRERWFDFLDKLKEEQTAREDAEE